MTRLVENLKANVGTISTIVVFVSTLAFYIGIVIAKAEARMDNMEDSTAKEIQDIKKEQDEQKKANIKIMEKMMVISLNVEAIAGKLGVQTK